MSIEFLLERFGGHREKTALVCGEKSCTYGWLLGEVSRLSEELAAKILPGTLVMLEADYSPLAVAHLLALIRCGAIVVPCANATDVYKRNVFQIAQAEVIICIDSKDNIDIVETGNKAEHELYAQLRAAGHPGLVLFSSGSIGKCKAVVHDMTRLLAKYRMARRDFVTLGFLLFDHIGGMDTLFYCLSNTSTLVVPSDRSPDGVCAAVERNRVEVLPVSPTFLNLLFLSEARTRHDLSSLKYVTYGTEVMPQATLDRCREAFKGVTILQKYGATEVGTLRSKSKDSGSLWLKVGGEGYQTRVVDGMLQIKADSSMLGYLNWASPFTEDGWFKTGDAVEVDGDYIRILGRKSEIINVGGQKVYPAQVEGVLQEMDEIAEALVYGEKNPIVGNIVCATILPTRAVDEKQLMLRIRQHCRAKLQAYQVPVKITLSDTKQHSARFKKVRSSHAGAA